MESKRPPTPTTPLANLCLGLGYPIVAGRESLSVRIQSVGRQAFQNGPRPNVKKVACVHAPHGPYRRQKIRSDVEMEWWNCLHRIESQLSCVSLQFGFTRTMTSKRLDRGLHRADFAERLGQQ